jgi:hypothetical protein
LVPELLDDIVTLLRYGPDRWEPLIASTPAHLLTREPEPGEWTALGCLQHLIDVEVVFLARAKSILAGENFAAFDPDADGNAAAVASDPMTLFGTFRSLRAVSFETIEAIQPADLTRTAVHAELGTVTLQELLSEWAGHDLMHAVQAERAIMQPFIVQTGPWRFYFADHDVSPDAG